MPAEMSDEDLEHLRSIAEGWRRDKILPDLTYTVLALLDTIDSLKGRLLLLEDRLERDQ